MLAASPNSANVLLVVNRLSPISQEIGAYYTERRSVPQENICRIAVDPAETIDRTAFQSRIAAPIGSCLTRLQRTRRILYVVTTKGIPLRIRGSVGLEGDAAAVDSELAQLPKVMAGEDWLLEGAAINPYFGTRDMPPDAFGILLVTRLTGYDYADVVGAIDRGLRARNRGVFVIDGDSNLLNEGTSWLFEAAGTLPNNRVLTDYTSEVLYDQEQVIGYASWGSNDHRRLQDGRRDLGFDWLPGAIATEYVSTNGRTFEEPPKDWRPTATSILGWLSPWARWSRFYAGSPQSLTADLIRQGATGASGHVYEPFLVGTPRPQLVFRAYLDGYTLAESFYRSIPYLSWMNIVVGDPLCRLGAVEPEVSPVTSSAPRPALEPAASR